jgi:C4-dicarboxylate-specific signal transduction histidine kinase
VDRIAADAHRAGEIIRRIRQFVRKRDADRIAVDANQLVREVVRFMEYEAADRRISIELKLADGLPKVRVDPIEIQQVILNLVRNAFDALDRAPDDKRICAVRSRRLDDATVELTIEDTGPGISESLRQQVFEPFYTTKEEGLGMGLAISRSIAESHGGGVAAGRSSLGGAALQLTLPASEEDATHG